MKNLKYIFAIALAGFTLSCTEMLDEEMYTDISLTELYSTPEGLSRAVVGLYSEMRKITMESNSEQIGVAMLDYSTDLMVFRAGTAAALGRLDNVTPALAFVENFWRHNYNLIGKANDIIAAAEKMNMEDKVVKQAWAEAKMFRARSYFDLFKRFDRIYLNLIPTTGDNVERKFTPAAKEDVFAAIHKDLDDAMGVLAWTAGSDHGRFNKAAAKHIKAQVAMWEKDWATAIEQCEDIFECADYGLLDDCTKVFEGANLTHKEVLFSYQYANEVGGANVDGAGLLVGHCLSLITTPNYKKVPGLNTMLAEHGGYGWGRCYPNQHLLNMYNKTTDKRYLGYFKHEWYYMTEKELPEGKNLGDVAVVDNTLYLEALHPMSRKYFDQWTNADLPTRKSSFKDIIIYRLAETYLMAAEACYHKGQAGDAAAAAKALTYYNKTWMRAGNPEETAPLTLEMLLDEYARELNFEGVRWPLLKRLGLLETYVKLYEGDLKSEDPKLAADTAKARANFKSHHWYWPIPQSEIDQMGQENFPQNEGY